MPKLGMEPIRRAALVEATITEIGEAGTLEVSVSRIARRAGMSSALAFHYFGGKDELLQAAMRHILTLYGQEVRVALASAGGPRDRIEAIIRAGFVPANFRTEVIAAWLNFYVLALTSLGARRLLRLYHKRLHSNLTHGLRPLVEQPEAVAERLAALIDGLYLRAALGGKSAEVVTDHVIAAFHRELDETHATN